MLNAIALGLAAFVLLSAAPAIGAACEGLRPGPSGLVVQVTDGDTVVLDNGLTVRLVGTQAPKLPLGREGFEAWPMAEEAKQALEALALGRPARLGFGGLETDRHGRALGQMFVETAAGEEVWVQASMVAAGLARVYSFPDNRSCLEALLEAERKARTNRLGIWSDPYYSVRQADRPDALLARSGHYELVEGRVLLAEAAGGRVYLNFGRQWKQDFTVVIDSRSLKPFAGAGLDPLALEGALIRVRGWVDDRDGPRIEVTHPEQIEVLARQ